MVAAPMVTRGQTGRGGTESAVMGGESARALTPFEEFAGKLKLDDKTQQPAAIEIINAAASEAGAVGAQILQIRQRILNAELSGSADDVKAATADYVTAEAKMAAIEANAFSKVLALTKPNQQKDAAQAFALLAGFFQRAAATGGRGGR
jgi:hypothetical protein